MKTHNITAEEFDELFDSGADLSEFFEDSPSCRPNLDPELKGKPPCEVFAILERRKVMQEHKEDAIAN